MKFSESWLRVCKSCHFYRRTGGADDNGWPRSDSVEAAAADIRRDCWRNSLVDKHPDADKLRVSGRG